MKGSVYRYTLVNINDVIQYCKRECGFPYTSIELSDEDIINIIKFESLQLFEQYVPDLGRRTINKGSKKFRVKKNLYWVIDPLDREVFWVQSVEPEESELLANVYPYQTPIVNYDMIPDLLGRIEKAHTSMRYGRSLIWIQEDGTNQVWIFSADGISNKYSVSYTRSHAPDLSTINREYAIDFANICAANVMMIIGQIRNKYTNLSTPVGELGINGSELFSNGQSLLSSTIEKLDKIKPTYGVGMAIF